jgi:hypothetical protein
MRKMDSSLLTRRRLLCRVKFGDYTLQSFNPLPQALLPPLHPPSSPPS